MKEKIKKYIRNKQKSVWEKTFNTNMLVKTKPVIINNITRRTENANNYKRSKLY